MPAKKKSPALPSVEDQLTAARVTRGSALEKLIQDNQDFDLLEPGESHDNIKLPLWLRVYWRKSHPELEISARDPLGAYPDTLFRVYAWMLHHHDLPWGSADAPAGKKEGTR